MKALILLLGLLPGVIWETIDQAVEAEDHQKLFKMARYIEGAVYDLRFTQQQHRKERGNRFRFDVVRAASFRRRGLRLGEP